MQQYLWFWAQVISNMFRSHLRYNRPHTECEEGYDINEQRVPKLSGLL